MPLDVSEDGEANTEIGLLLGLTGRLLTALASRLPALEQSALAVLGPATRVGVVSSTSAHYATTACGCDPSERLPAGRRRRPERLSGIRSVVDRWWLHVDLDVLDPLEFRAQGLPG